MNEEIQARDALKKEYRILFEHLITHGSLDDYHGNKLSER